MKIIILCGGRGTRIQEVTNSIIPKPMVNIGKYPILWHIMNLYDAYGYNEFVLCLGHMGWQIKSYFLNYKAMMNNYTLTLNNPEKITFDDENSIGLDWKITFAETGENAQTGARIRKIRRYVEDDDYFMLTYGDGLSDVNILKLIEFHKTHNKIAPLYMPDLYCR